MKKVSVIVKDKTVLELKENASIGDIIDLKEIESVDTSYLDLIIESGKDKVYEAKLNDVKKAINAENELKLQELRKTIDLNEEKHKRDLKEKEQSVIDKYRDEIAKLTQRLDSIAQERKSEIDLLKSQNDTEKERIKKEESEKYHTLEQKYNLLSNELDSKIKAVKLELENDYIKKIKDLESKQMVELEKKDNIIKNKELSFELEKNKELNKQKDEYEEKLKEKEDTINHLQRAKASMNVKQTGEDLEAWCDNEVTSYMQNGLFNCTWTKDNKTIREEDEAKGSKADYIFKVYANNSHEEPLLASVCLDMKDENPDSINKKSNADYYKQLDKNREKKNCKYAVLVSNLEMDKPNILPIFKVREYEDMYVVRPAYLMTFLNMITSLTVRFQELILHKEGEELKLQAKLKLLEEFEDIKKTYLDKPLESLEKAIVEITKNTENISKAIRNIDEQCDKINRTYISQIFDKIERYELKLNRSIVKKLDE